MILHPSWYHLSFCCHCKARIKPGVNTVTQHWLILTRMQLYACVCSGSMYHRCTDHILTSIVGLQTVSEGLSLRDQKEDGENPVQNKVRNTQGHPH